MDNTWKQAADATKYTPRPPSATKKSSGSMRISVSGNEFAELCEPSGHKLLKSPDYLKVLGGNF